MWLLNILVLLIIFIMCIILLIKNRRPDDEEHEEEIARRTFYEQELWRGPRHARIKQRYEGAGGVKWVCFFIPLVGLILYLVWKDEKPIAANECGIFGLIGFVMGIAFSFILYILMYSMLLSSFNQLIAL